MPAQNVLIDLYVNALAKNWIDLSHPCLLKTTPTLRACERTLNQSTVDSLKNLSDKPANAIKVAKMWVDKLTVDEFKNTLTLAIENARDHFPDLPLDPGFIKALKWWINHYSGCLIENLSNSDTQADLKKLLVFYLSESVAAIFIKPEPITMPISATRTAPATPVAQPPINRMITEFERLFRRFWEEASTNSLVGHMFRSVVLDLEKIDRSAISNDLLCLLEDYLKGYADFVIQTNAGQKDPRSFERIVQESMKNLQHGIQELLSKKAYYADNANRFMPAPQPVREPKCPASSMKLKN